MLYIGVSDTPAWIVSQANTLAALRGWTPLVGLQIEYSLIGRSPAQVALAWLCHQGDPIIPMIGARKLSQLEDNLGCLDVELTPEHLARLDEVSLIDLGFPHHFLKQDTVRQIIYSGAFDQIDGRRG